MRNGYHAGPKYSREQQEQLNEAFSAWLTVEAISENNGWSDETLVKASITTFTVYETLRAEFDAANEAQAYALEVARAEALYKAAIVGLRPLADQATAQVVWAEEADWNELLRLDSPQWQEHEVEETAYMHSAATVERLRHEMRQAREDERLEMQREYDGRELVDQEPPFDGWM